MAAVESGAVALPADASPSAGQKGSEASKRSAAAVSGSENVDSNIKGSQNLANKRQKTSGGGATKQKTRADMTPEELEATLKRQVEYYLSDTNLATDAFFHGKIEEAEKQGKGVSLEIAYVLSSPRIRHLNATKQEIIDALKESGEVSLTTDEEGKTWIVRKGPLPTLQKRKDSRKNERRREGASGHGLGRDPHAIGMLVKISNLPANFTKWQEIKDAIREKLPGKVHVRYVSRVDARQQCTVWLGSFEGDREFFKEPLPLAVEGGEATAALMTDGEARGCLSDLPPRVRMCREKELQQFRRQLAGVALSMAGVPFNSVDHLHRCINDFLDKTEAGKCLKAGSAGEKTVLALLEYHPNAYFKKGGHDKTPVGVKVDLHTKTNAKTGENTKCFFVVRKHNETGEEDFEDFSVSKCIAELSRDPPVEPEAFKAFMQKRYEATASACDAAQEHLQKRKAAAAEAAAATAASTEGEAKAEEEAKAEGATTEETKPESSS